MALKLEFFWIIIGIVFNRIDLVLCSKNLSQYLCAVIWKHRIFCPNVGMARGDLGLCPRLSTCWESGPLGSSQREEDGPKLLQLPHQTCCGCWPGLLITFHIHGWELQQNTWTFFWMQSYNSLNIKHKTIQLLEDNIGESHVILGKSI